MFAPVVKEAFSAARGRAIGAVVAEAARRRSARPRARVRRDPDRPADAPVEAPPPARSPGGRRRRPATSASTRPLELLDGARGPLIWAGGGALQAGAGEAVARARRAARRAGDPHLLGARACCAPTIRCLVGAPPHVPEVGRALGRGGRGDRHRQRPRRHDDPGLGACRSRRTWSRSTWTPPTLPRTICPTWCWRRDARGGRGAAAPSASAGRLEPLAPRGCAELSAGVRRGLGETDPEAIGFLDAFDARAARRGGRGLRHVHPRLLARRLPPPAGRRASSPTRSAGGRSAAPSRRRSGAALAGAGPGRSASRATAASCTPAASWRPRPRSASRSPRWSWTTAATGCCASTRTARATRTTAWTCTRPTSPRWPRSFGVRAEAVDGLGADLARRAGAPHRLDEPACWWRGPALPPPPNVSPRWYRAASAH